MSENRSLTEMLRSRPHTFPEQSRNGSRPSADDSRGPRRSKREVGEEMSNMPQPPEGPPSMPRHTTRLVPKPPRPRRYASMRETAEWLKGYRLGRTIRIDLAEVDDAMLPFGAS